MSIQCNCHQNKPPTWWDYGCVCHNQGYSTGTTGTPGSDVVSGDNIKKQNAGGGKIVSQVTSGDFSFSTIMDSVKTACTKELSRRGKQGVTWETSGAGYKMSASLVNQVRDAITNCGGGVASVGYGQKITYSWFIGSLIEQLSALQNTCICDCNYCTCNCNYCGCYCNYCTCHCDYCNCVWRCDDCTEGG